MGMARGCIAIFVLAAGAFAQGPTATLLGQIEDSTGAMLPGAMIRARSLTTNETRQTTSDDQGNYLISNLPPTAYEITVEKTGFKRLIESSVELQVDQSLRLDLRLTLGNTAETVEVSTQAPLINTESATRGEVITSREINDMPLEGRDFNDLSFLVPGVARRAQGGQGSALSVNGARGDNTNFFVDGFNNRNFRGGSAVTRPPIDAIQEFKLQVTGYPAEYGQFAGGAMNIVIKSGGNRFHGTVFEYLRNDFFDARNFFDPQKAKLRRNQFGAMLNGPVIRNKTFFLVSWESYRQVIGATRLSRTPTLLERQGDFSQTIDPATRRIVALRDPLAANVPFAGNILPRDRFDPIAVRVARYYPEPNRTGVNNFRANLNDRDVWDSFLFKVDHRLTEKDQLSARFIPRWNSSENPFNGSDLGLFGNNTRDTLSLGGITHTRMVSANKVNELRAGFSYSVQDQRSFQFGTDWNKELGLPSPADPLALGFPRITVRDLVSIGNDAAMPARFTVLNPEIGDTFTWVLNKHLVKFGGNANSLRFNQPSFANMRGTYNFLGRWTNDPYADFLMGLLNNATRRADGPVTHLRQFNAGLFFQDDWRISKSLTFNIGLRYEILLPMTERDGKLANFIPSLGKIVIASDRALPDLEARLASANLIGRVDYANRLGLPDGLVHPRWDNIAPRFGFAWRPRNSNKMVIRSGYGIFFAGSGLNPVRGDLADTFPFAVTQTFNRLTTDPKAVTLQNPFPTSRLVLDSATNGAGYDHRARTQYMQAWNLTIERELTPDLALELAYMGSKGTHLGRRYDVNQPLRDPAARTPSGAFPRPYAGLNTIDYYTFGSNSNYHAGIVTVRRRLTRSAFVRVNYIFGKSIDDASQISGNATGGYPGAQDARNIRLERGRSDFDNRHTVTTNFVYELPLGRGYWRKGWQMSGSGRIYSGQPFTPRTSNVQLDQGEANRPDRIASGRRANRTPDAWFDIDAFPVVPLGAFRLGNSGRNILDGPGFVGVNLGLNKRFDLWERQTLQFRWEVFNIANRANFNLPNNNVNAVNGGTIIDAMGPRSMQFALKYIF